MRKKRLARITHAVTPFLLLALLFLGGLYYVLLSTMSRAVSENAEIAAAPWSAYLGARPLELQRLQSGEGLSPEASGFFSAYALGQRIAGFQLLSAQGQPMSAMIEPEAARRAPSRTQTDGLTTTVLPLTAAGRAPLRLAVLSDQTIREQAFQEEFLRAFIALCFLTACSFGVPAFVFLRELAQRERGEERMEFLAQHDVMTKLMNRGAFNSAFEAALARRTDGEQIALHFVDLDRFKSVNDSLGHNIGDELIKTVAAKLSAIVGPGDFVARFGGDEFIMAQVGLNSVQEAEARAGEIRQAFAQPMSVGEHLVRTTASVGVAVSPRDGTSLSTLTRAADLAVYGAKAAGRDTWRMYDPQMDVALQKRQRIEKALLAACANESFILHFQPIVRSESKKLLGFEVLLRLRAEHGDVATPTEFIPIAEEMGLISQIGAWVLRKACAVAANWPESLIVAVNLSPRQFESGELCAVIETALRESGLCSRRLELEITEGLLLADTDRVMAQLRDIKALGVSIAMDDFGTGYSSLSYLWRFPFDKLKIDRSFMRVLTEGDGNVSSILNTIIALGRTLNLRVTAEGVETEEQARLLRELNCDQLQGYHFGRPMPETDLASAILEGSWPQLLDQSDDQPAANAA
jgi:diguanylate cyclase (GGDEF)-like protein